MAHGEAAIPHSLAGRATETTLALDRETPVPHPPPASKVAPFIQATPALHEQLLCYTLPPVR